MGLSENSVYSQWNSHLKTGPLGFRGFLTIFRHTHIHPRYRWRSHGSRHRAIFSWPCGTSSVSVATLAASFSALELFEAMAPPSAGAFWFTEYPEVGGIFFWTWYGTLYEYVRLCSKVLYHASLFEPSFGKISGSYHLGLILDSVFESW